MLKRLILIAILLISFGAIGSEQFMKDCDRHLRSEQSAQIAKDKAMIEQYRKTITNHEEHAKVDQLEKQYDEKINGEISRLCTCMKDKATESLKITGLSDGEIKSSLNDIGQAMLHQNYFMIDEVSRKAVENTVVCSL